MTWTEGTTSFSFEVPYRLSRGAPEKSIVVALHGMGEDEGFMARRLAPLRDRGVSLLLPRAPHPIEIRRAEEIRIGYGWYHYDGNADRFIESMSRAAGYLLTLIARIAGGDRVFLVGFSQGAYLAYYVALRHAERFSGVCGIGGRAKHEAFGEYLEHARHVRVLHLHGEDDAAVSPDACRASIEALGAAGLDAEFRLVAGGHTVSPEMARAIAEFVEGRSP